MSYPLIAAGRRSYKSVRSIRHLNRRRRALAPILILSAVTL